jgi:hypothetical protein
VNIGGVLLCRSERRPDMDGRDKPTAVRLRPASLALSTVMVGGGRPSTSLPAKGLVFLLLSDWPQLCGCKVRRSNTETTEIIEVTEEKGRWPCTPTSPCTSSVNSASSVSKYLQSHRPAYSRSDRAVIDNQGGYRIKGWQTRGWSAPCLRGGKPHAPTMTVERARLAGRKWDSRGTSPAMTIEGVTPAATGRSWGRNLP